MRVLPGRAYQGYDMRVSDKVRGREKERNLIRSQKEDPALTSFSCIMIRVCSALSEVLY